MSQDENESIQMLCRRRICEAVIDLQSTAQSQEERRLIDAAITGALSLQLALHVAETSGEGQSRAMQVLKQHELFMQSQNCSSNDVNARKRVA